MATAASHPPVFSTPVDSTPSQSRSRPSNERLRLRSLKQSKGSVENFHQKRTQQPSARHNVPHHYGGQNMRVGNVTANGRLELRPIRPLHPPSAFPATPPHSPHKQPSGRYNDRRRSFLSNDTASEFPDAYTSHNDGSQRRSKTPPQPYGRSYSLSTVSDSLGHGHALTKRNLSFKRKKDALDHTTDAFDGFSGHSPRETQDGARTSASVESHVLSTTHRDLRSSHPSTRTPQTYGYDSHSGSDRISAHRKPRMTRSAGPPSPHRRPAMPSASMPERFFPDATVTVELEAPAWNGERPLVRTSRVNGQIMAATKAGLVAQITSPDLLDYELLSDFFLTFRSFMSPMEVLIALLKRLSWAIQRADDFGRIVRVRVFVGLRHWILNYFEDDFVPDYELRRQLCLFINNLAVKLASRDDGGAGDLKVVGEVKKCWRRTCAQFFDEEEHRQETALAEIQPGGSRSQPNLHETGSQIHDTASPPNPNNRQSVTPSMFNHPFRGRNVPHSSTENAVIRPESRRHRDSDQSLHVTSCSIPIRSHRKSRPGTAEPALSSQTLQTGPKRVPSASLPPSVARSRSRVRNNPTGKLADSLAVSGKPGQDHTSAQPSQDYFSTPMLSGDLIRGVTLKPTLPQVETMFPFTPRGSTSSLSSEAWSEFSRHFGSEYQSSGPSPGMKRFLGSMKRALSGKHEFDQTVAGGEEQRSRKPYRSGHASSKKSTQKDLPMQLSNPTAMPRIDLLAAKILDAFEEFEKDSSKTDIIHKPSDASSGERSAQLPWDQSVDHRSFELRRIESSAVTGGSRSIVIVDGTGKNIELPPLPALTSLVHHTPYDQAPRGVSEQTIPVGLDRRTMYTEGEAHSDAHDLVTPPESPPTNQYGTDDQGPVIEGPYSRESQLLSSEPGYDSDEEDDRDAALDDMHQLKRQPGGNLRAAEHVHSLLARPGTVSTQFTDTSALSPESKHTKNASAEDGQPPVHRKLSLLDTSSAQPKFTPSWQRAMAKMARIPDCRDDEGVEAALRNLEGSPEREAMQPAEMDARAYQALGAAQAQEDFPKSLEVSEQVKAEHREDEIFAGSPIDEEDSQQQTEAPANRPTTFFEDDSRLDLDRLDLNREVSLASHPSDPSDVSSIPLIKRGGSGPPRRRPTSSCEWLAVSLPPAKPASPVIKPASPEVKPTSPDVKPASPGIAPPADDSDFVAPSPVRRHVRTNACSKLPGSSSTHKSFLLDDDESLNEAAFAGEQEKESTYVPEQEVVEEKHDDDAQSTFFDDSFSVITDSGNAIFSHPLRHSATPTQKKSTTAFKQLPPSVLDFLPAHELKPLSRGRPLNTAAMTSENEPANPDQIQPHTMKHHPNHLPFIMSETSLVLAQQFTLVERDALTGIDWRQLVEMRWSQHATVSDTWTKVLMGSKATETQVRPRFAQHTDVKRPTGIDLCTDRFNIMVKWAMSEVVLCDTPAERAVCIQKYIHIATHARRLQNWATMYQIVAGLLSSDVSRLKMTWERVHEEDKATLKRLETLISPTRNFQNLRNEMENAFSAPSNVDHGCIPFLGLYTHDLIYNAQKPKFAMPDERENAEGKRVQDQMINFERQRTAAGIVKNLLRMLDASTRYEIEPKPEVLSRCLWMACLSDGEISARSRALEP